MYILRTEKQDGSKLTFMPFEIVSICVWHFLRNMSSCILFTFRGVPAYTQSTQLRTLIPEFPKNKNVLNREKCNKNMPHQGKVFKYRKKSEFVGENYMNNQFTSSLCTSF